MKEYSGNICVLPVNIITAAINALLNRDYSSTGAHGNALEVDAPRVITDNNNNWEHVD